MIRTRLLTIVSAIVSILSTCAMEPTMDPSDRDAVKRWLPLRLHDRVEEVYQLVMQEDVMIPIVKNEEDSGNDYGYSFPRVNAIQQACLEVICELYEKEDARPLVLFRGWSWIDVMENNCCWRMVNSTRETNTNCSSTPTKNNAK